MTRFQSIPSATLFFLLLFDGGIGYSAEPSAVEAKAKPAASYGDQIRQLLPVAWWSFDDGRPDVGMIEGKVEFGKAGPGAKDFKTFSGQNLAASFGNTGKEKGGYLFLEDPGAGSQFDLTMGIRSQSKPGSIPTKSFQSTATCISWAKAGPAIRDRRPTTRTMAFGCLETGSPCVSAFSFEAKPSERTRAIGIAGILPLDLLWERDGIMWP